MNLSDFLYQTDSNNLEYSRKQIDYTCLLKNTNNICRTFEKIFISQLSKNKLKIYKNKQFIQQEEDINNSIMENKCASINSYFIFFENYSIQPQIIQINNNENQYLYQILIAFFTIVIVMMSFIMYNVGKKRGKAENNSLKQILDQTENYRYYFSSLTNKKPIANNEYPQEGNRENPKDESSSTKSSPNFANYTKSHVGTAIDTFFKLDQNDVIETSKSSPVGNNISQRNRLNELLLLPEFKLQYDENNIPERKSSSTLNPISTPILNPTSIVPFCQGFTIPERVNNYDKIFLSYEYDSKKDCDSEFYKEYSEKFVKEKIKLGETEDIDNISGYFQAGIREKDGKIEKIERTEVVTVLNRTKDVEDNLKLLKDATENPEVMADKTPIISPIFKQLIVSKKIIDFSTEENDEKNIENKEIIRLNKVKMITDEECKIKSKNELKKVLDFDKSSQDCIIKNPIIKTNNDQLLQYLREKLDIPDETGKFSRMFTDNLLIGEGSYGKVFKVNFFYFYACSQYQY